MMDRIARAMAMDAEQEASGSYTKAETDALLTSVAAIGTCETAGNVAEKVVTMPQGWSLRTGSIIGVLFSNTNSASNVTLNVGGTGAKAIRAGSGTSATRDVFCGKANFYSYYMYDGTNWVWLNYNYCPPKISTSEIDAGTSTDDRVISPQRLEYAFNTKSMCLGAGNVIAGDTFESDLNNYKTLGVYSTTKNSSSFTNVPPGAAANRGFRLTVMMDHPSNICQIYDEFWSEKRWMRPCTVSGSFGNWVLVDTDMSVIKGINSSEDDYIELKSGVRLYITDTTPTGTIPAGSVGIGF